MIIINGKKFIPKKIKIIYKLKNKFLQVAHKYS